MIFLAIDTGGDYAVLALGDTARPNSVIGALAFEGRRTLSVQLFRQIDALLVANGLTQDSIEAYAVGIGPGSFTGLRVGMTTVKTLAQVTGRPLVGVGTLDAYAASLAIDTPGQCLVPVVHSRRNEVYTAIYVDGRLVEGPLAIAPAELETRLEAYRESNTIVFAGERGVIAPYNGVHIGVPYVPADGLVRLAAARLAVNDFDDPLGLLPAYVALPTITTPKVKALTPQPPLPILGEGEPEGI
ncbi:MAG: tRNA (adenosine(37)-N6)-threonylcarbamoyltransferase complex dimerization subunit type 1 TsaB [Capsulimonas sp.]|uniref:tRNA (adenosine(37)-N6)-threonylcarbamoyltransferase complex dimerization subunit type 1 TsaB n=1 Tax=Capsulimonas sp. TaxID=2494211 RepID=UPI00326528DF